APRARSESGSRSWWPRSSGSPWPSRRSSGLPSVGGSPPELIVVPPKGGRMAYEICEELSVEIQDAPGALAKALKAVTDAGVAIRAFCGYSMGGAGNVMIVAKNPAKAKAALKKAGYKAVTTSKVVVGTTKDERGAGASITGKAREKGINLEYAYA